MLAWGRNETAGFWKNNKFCVGYDKTEWPAEILGQCPIDSWVNTSWAGETSWLKLRFGVTNSSLLICSRFPTLILHFIFKDIEMLVNREWHWIGALKSWEWLKVHMGHM